MKKRWKTCALVFTEEIPVELGWMYRKHVMEKTQAGRMGVCVHHHVGVVLRDMVEWWT